jgi:baseplate J-like protein
VIVVVVPADVHAAAAPSGELCADVEDYVRARCAPDAQVTVIGPSWVATDVTIDLAPTSVEASDDAVAAAREAVTRLLDPLTGGAGAGWDLGRCPRESDFAASFAELPGIDHVSTIRVTCTPAFKDTAPATKLLIDELSLYPRLLAYARTIVKGGHGDSAWRREHVRDDLLRFAGPAHVQSNQRREVGFRVRADDTDHVDDRVFSRGRGRKAAWVQGSAHGPR